MSDRSKKAFWKDDDLEMVVNNPIIENESQKTNGGVGANGGGNPNQNLNLLDDNNSEMAGESKTQSQRKPKLEIEPIKRVNIGEFKDNVKWEIVVRKMTSILKNLLFNVVRE